VLLDFSAPGMDTTQDQIQPLEGAESVQQFLDDVSRAALEGRTVTRGEYIRALVPVHARSFLASLSRRTFTESRFIVGNLQSLIARPAEVTRARRIGSLAFVPVIGFIMAAFVAAMLNFERIRWDRAWSTAFPGQPSLRVAAEIYRDDAETVKELLKLSPTVAASEKKGLDLAGAYIATHWGALITNKTFWAGQPNLRLEPDSQSALEEAVKEYSNASAKVVAEAEREMTRRIAKRERSQRFGFIWVGVGTMLFVIAVAMMTEFIGAAAFRTLPVLRVFGITAVNRAGAPASRWRLLWRSALVWIPLLVALLIITGIFRDVTNDEPAFSLAVEFSIVVFLIAATDFVAIYAMVRPNAALQDRLAGTRLVPV
jgi:hypothetical protein